MQHVDAWWATCVRNWTYRRRLAAQTHCRKPLNKYLFTLQLAGQRLGLGAMMRVLESESCVNCNNLSVEWVRWLFGYWNYTPFSDLSTGMIVLILCSHFRSLETLIGLITVSTTYGTKLRSLAVRWYCCETAQKSQWSSYGRKNTKWSLCGVGPAVFYLWYDVHIRTFHTIHIVSRCYNKRHSSVGLDLDSNHSDTWFHPPLPSDDGQYSLPLPEC